MNLWRKNPAKCIMNVEIPTHTLNAKKFFLYKILGIVSHSKFLLLKTLWKKNSLMFSYLRLVIQAEEG